MMQGGRLAVEFSRSLVRGPLQSLSVFSPSARVGWLAGSPS